MSEKTAGEVYKQNIGSVVYVSTQSGRGSGVVVGDNEVVTNCHVIDDGSPVMVTKPNADFTDAQRVPAKVAAGSRLDMCLLKTEGLSAPAVALGETKSVGIGDPVYAISNPGGVFGTLSGGLVSQVHPSSAAEGEGAGGLIQTDTALSGGSSGGGLFDRSGRLIGITTGLLGRGESLHKSLPVELVKYLRQRAGVEAPLHDELTAALNDPSAEKFRALAGRIVESFSDPVHASFARRLIGDYEAQFGDKKAAALQAEAIRALADSQSGEARDKILVDAVQVTADMGEIESAKNLAGKIGRKWRRAQAFAHIVRELATMGKSVDEVRKLCDERVPLKEILDAGAEAPPLESLTAFLGEVASARAATEDSEEALRIAEWAIRQHPGNPHNTVQCAEVLARIAYQLRRQEVFIGASALFNYAVRLAGGISDISECLVGLTNVAYHAARSGDGDEAVHALEATRDIEKKAEGGGNYHSRLTWTGNAAEAHALIGDVRGAISRIKRIRILGDELAAALVGAAVAMSRLR